MYYSSPSLETNNYLPSSLTTPYFSSMSLLNPYSDDIHTLNDLERALSCITPNTPCFLRLDVHGVLKELNSCDPPNYCATSLEAELNCQNVPLDETLQRNFHDPATCQINCQTAIVLDQSCVLQTPPMQNDESTDHQPPTPLLLSTLANNDTISHVIPKQKRKKSSPSTCSPSLSPISKITKQNKTKKPQGRLITETITTTPSSIQHSFELPKESLKSFSSSSPQSECMSRKSNQSPTSCHYSTTCPQQSSSNKQRNLASWTLYKEQAFVESGKEKSKSGNNYKFHNVSFVYVPSNQ
ncbi:hypothetical protein C9374_000888 [Naegleria lovaniensis]|uniref:Uncharacterized protein n=1 Tax=Naegleria lovaniensis TaxID=51637 RepID=A0AA88GX77_NAELO|nr:uncharacterized protein C9374_000888 [Naegleria lovaniensis]KAG2388038.1 hypothetical protein C9374_000888 [Naegleria lovaniensis]